MNKGLEALEQLSKLVFVYGGVEQYRLIEKELKALDIIIKKDITPSWFIRNLKKGMTYDAYHYSNSGTPYDMTQEEFELLKEELL